MRLFIRSESIEISPHKLATGVIYFADTDWAFPEDTWNDLVDVLLLAWSRMVLDVFSGMKEQATLYFMDGPFSVGLVCEANRCRSLLIKSETIVRSIAEFDAAELISSIWIAGGSLLANDAFLTQMAKQASELRVKVNRLKRLSFL